MKTFAYFWRFICITCLITSQSMLPVYAEEMMHGAAPTEEISLRVGDIFEILPIHSIQNPTFTWILTQDRTFLEASRAPSFRKRLIQPGSYSLYAEIASQDGSQRFTRTIALQYAAREPGQTYTNTTATTEQTLVTTEPASTTNGKVAMAKGKQLLLLQPVNPNIVPLAIDLDTNKDADGDGKADNDIQSSETFFHTDATPLYVWITNEPLTTHSISVTAAMPDGARTQKIEILNEDIARAQGAIQSPIRIETKATSERTYTFTPVFENPAAAEGQLLYQWQFGDGQQSLLTKPEHTYAENGTYSVSLLVRNLRDGSEVASTATSLKVDPSVAQASSTSSEDTTTPSSPSGTSNFSLGSILMMAGLFLGSVILGVGIIMLLGLLRKKKITLADTIESIEQTVIKTPGEATAPLVIAPPVKIAESKRMEPPAEIAEREKAQVVERPAPAPVVQKENTPAWLTPTTPKVTPAPSTPVTPVPPVPTPAAPAVPPMPKPTPVVKPATPAPTPTVPPVPKPAPVAPTTVVPPPSKPAPVVPPAPASEKTTPVVPPAVQPVPTPATPVVPPAPKLTPVVTPPTQTPTPTVAPVPKPTPATPTPAVPAATAPTFANTTPAWLQQPVATPFQPNVEEQPKNPQSTPADLKNIQPVSPLPSTPKDEKQSINQDVKVLTQDSEMDQPSDEPIAIIRAESLNPPEL